MTGVSDEKGQAVQSLGLNIKIRKFKEALKKIRASRLGDAQWDAQMCAS